jgi:hypothetical protein
MLVLKKSYCIFLLLLSLVSSHHAFAQGGGSNGRLEAFLSAGYLGLSASASEISIGPGFNFVPFQGIAWLQAGGEITYQKISYEGGSTSTMLILAGVTANVGQSMGDAFFISLGLADRSGSASYEDPTSISPGGIGFYFFAGKRFPISGTLSLRPSLGVVSCGTTGMVFRPFAMSYLF